MKHGAATKPMHPLSFCLSAGFTDKSDLWRTGFFNAVFIVCI